MKKTAALIIALLLTLSTIAMALPAVAEAPALTLDREVYEVGEPIMVTATGSGADWVGLYRAGESVDPTQGGVTAIYWYYVAKDGNVSGQAKNIREAEHTSSGRQDELDLCPGEYTVVLCANDGYTILAQVNLEIRDKEVPPEEGDLLKTDKTEYQVGEPIMVTATGSGADWVGLYLVDDAVEDVKSIKWYYVDKDGNTSGSAKNIKEAEHFNEIRAELFGVPAGKYKVVLCANDSYTVLAQVNFEVRGEEVPPEEGDLLKTDKTEYQAGESIMVTATGSGADWVGLYLVDDVPKEMESIKWYYVAMDGNTSGSTKNIKEAEHFNESRAALFDVPAGEYKVVLFANGGYTILTQVLITVTGHPDAVPEAPASATYTSANAGEGRADGVLKISADTNRPEGYVAFWANAEGRLPGYTSIVNILCEDRTTVYTLPDHSLIPNGADRIIVYAYSQDILSETFATAMLPEGAGDYALGEVLYELQVMSDIHINASDTHLHNKHFAAALADIKTLSPNSIGIFINGDIADNGQASEYDAFNRLIAAAGEGLPPVLCAVGNHDLGGNARRQIPTFLAGTNNDSSTIYFDTWISGFHFVFMGSETAGLYADLSDAQLQWLDETLAKDRDEGRPTFVFLHQGLMDTVAGTFAYQQWHGVNQSARLREILAKYPEVVMFSGHSHWTLESASSMKSADSALPTIFNTASCAYLWDDTCMVTNQGITGSEGYYIYVYENRIVVRGRDFDNGLWVGSAQFVIERQVSEEKMPEEDTTPETEPTDYPETQPVTEPGTKPTGYPETQTVTEPETETAAAPVPGGGCRSAVSGTVTVLVLLSACGVAGLRKRKH